MMGVREGIGDDHYTVAKVSQISQVYRADIYMGSHPEITDKVHRSAFLYDQEVFIFFQIRICPASLSR